MHIILNSKQKVCYYETLERIIIICNNTMQ